MSVPYLSDLSNPTLFLKSKGFAEYTAKTFLSVASSQVAQRHFILDDSGSMNTGDGNVWTTKGSKQCTRWAELRETVDFVSEVSHLAMIPCRFHFLNATDEPIDVGFHPTSSSTNRPALMRRFDRDPEGGTPLCRVLRRVYDEIIRSLPHVPADKLIFIIICTDGVPSDGDISKVMELFTGMRQIRFILRLITDDRQILDYWDSIDKDIEVPVDVLDDIESEAKEVRTYNPWLEYNEALHFMRIFGFPSKLFDLLDETAFTRGQMEEFVKITYGELPTAPVFSVLRKKIMPPVRPEMHGRSFLCCLM